MRGFAFALAVVGCGDNTPMTPASAGIDISFSQPAYDFGRLPANTARPPGTVAVTNTGAAAVPVSLAITGFSIVATDCTMLHPGDNCTVSVDPTATTLGPTSGTLTVTAFDVVKSAELSATLEGVVTATSSGAGNIALSPSPDDCGGVACYPNGTVVTFTASPDATSYLASWSDPICGTSLQCTHVVDADPYALAAAFAPLTTTFTLAITGNGLGSVQIYRGDYDLVTTCTATCTVQVDHTIALTLVAQTPDDFVTFSTPCPPGVYHCDLPAGTTSATATFDAVPGEQDVFPLATPGVVYSIDFAPTGDVVLGTSQGVLAFDATFAPRWTSQLVGVARFASDGGVLVGTTTTIVKLDAAGTTLWTHAGGIALPSIFFIGHAVAATPTGGVAIVRGYPTGGSPTFEILDGAGNVIAASMLTLAPACVAIAPSGTIYVASIFDFLKAFTPDGQPAASVPAMSSDGNACAIAVNAHQIAYTQSADDETFMWYQRDTLDGAFVDLRMTDQLVSRLAYSGPGVALDPADNLLWYHPVPATFFDDPYTGVDLVKIAPTGATTWTVHRPSFAENGFRGGWTGLDIYDVVAAPDGRVAIAGVFHDVASDSDLIVDRAIVEVFPP